VDPNHREMLELHNRVNSHEPWIHKDPKSSNAYNKYYRAC
jgi:hypothetical protein